MQISIHDLSQICDCNHCIGIITSCQPLILKRLWGCSSVLGLWIINISGEYKVYLHAIFTIKRVNMIIIQSRPRIWSKPSQLSYCMIDCAMTGLDSIQYTSTLYLEMINYTPSNLILHMVTDIHIHNAMNSYNWSLQLTTGTVNVVEYPMQLILQYYEPPTTPWKSIFLPNPFYCQTSNIIRTSVGNRIVYH